MRDKGRSGVAVDWIREFGSDVLACLRFFSRLPVPQAWGERHCADAMAESFQALPVAGLVIGACGAMPLLLCVALQLPSGLAALVAVGCSVLASGGLHEDGLADVADGFGGGRDPERKLAIMRDSRIGSYGVLALVIALALRAGCLAGILDALGPESAAAAMLGGSALSRALAILPLVLLPPARPDGLGRSVGRPNPGRMATCFGLAAVLGAALPLSAGATLLHVVAACGLAALASFAMARLARRHIGGHTGDVAGASQQAAEIGYLIGLLVLPNVI